MALPARNMAPPAVSALGNFAVTMNRTAYCFTCHVPLPMAATENFTVTTCTASHTACNGRAAAIHIAKS
jgi:hypothetical protein